MSAGLPVKPCVAVTRCSQWCEIKPCKLTFFHGLRHMTDAINFAGEPSILLRKTNGKVRQTQRGVLFVLFARVKLRASAHFRQPV